MVPKKHVLFFWTRNKSSIEQACSQWLMVGLVLSTDRDFSIFRFFQPRTMISTTIWYIYFKIYCSSAIDFPMCNYNNILF